MHGFYFITDNDLSKRGSTYDVKAAVEAGVKIVQYRYKSLSAKDFFNEALELKKLCKKSIFIINDRLDIALAVEADGIHIGQDDLPLPVVRRIWGDERIVGVTVNTLEQALKAKREGATYLAVSPVFATATKDDAGPPCGLELVSKVKNACRLPVAAIGGIKRENAARVIAAGADMICAISATVCADNVKKEISEFQELYDDAIGKR
jgi:thiamine-phosphate pyrophosphorylase